MKTAWTEFLNWTNARQAADEAAEEASLARKKCDDHQLRIADVLKKHGPIVHDRHVYWLRDGEVVCEPCTDSFQLNLEEDK